MCVEFISSCPIPSSTKYRAGACHGERRAAPRVPPVEIEGEHYWDGGLVDFSTIRGGKGGYWEDEGYEWYGGI